MNNVLYIKVFSDLSSIKYQSKSLRIALGHILFGLGSLILTIFFTFFISDNQFFSVISIASFMLILGFITFAFRAYRIQPDISSAITNKQDIMKTKYAHDGGKTFIPVTWIAGFGLGILLNKIARITDWGSSLRVILLAFCAGAFLGVAFMYWYWEFKYNKIIRVYKYDLKKKETNLITNIKNYFYRR